MNEIYRPLYLNSWSIVVGVNQYKTLPNLEYAANDARDISSFLHEHLGFRTEQSIILIDSEATRESILDAYLALISKASSFDDRVLFFFAGHGLTLSGYRGQVGYLAPFDAEEDKPSTWIRWDELTRNADLIPAKHIFFILDACFSGLALKRAVYPGSQRFLSDMLSRRSRQVLTAGKADQEVADGGGPSGNNSIFTGYLLQGLSGDAANEAGILTANGLIHYVYDKLSQDPIAEQTPHMGHVDGDGDFILIAPGIESSEPIEKDQIIDVPKGVEPEHTIDQEAIIRPNFISENGYRDPSDPRFGRNQYSENLGYWDFTDGRAESTALSWLALVFEPASENRDLFDIRLLLERFREYKPIGTNEFERFLPPRTVMTTLSSLILYDPLTYESKYWGKYLRIEKNGAFEFTNSINSFFIYQDIRSFRYVQIIGMFWQFIHFVKDQLQEAEYSRGGSFFFNLVGTRDTILSDFASGKGSEGKKWIEPGERGYLMQGEQLLNLKCLDPHIQIRYEVVLGNIDGERSKELAIDAASQLGLAFNHQSEPRCFNYMTDVFPWNRL